MKCLHAQRPATRSLCRSRPGRAYKSMLLLVVVFACWVVPLPVKAQSQDDGERRLTETKFGPANHWLVKAWSDPEVGLCDFYLTGDDRPTEEQIRAACGAEMAEDWSATPACANYKDEKKAKKCEGLYLVHLGKREQQYEVVTLLPRAEAHFTLSNCANGEWCSQRPTLRIYGIEPLDDQHIAAVHIRTGSKTISCTRASECLVTVPTTTGRGTWLEYWVVSSYGDESERHSLQVRNVYERGAPSRYYFEVLSPEVHSDTAAVQWRAFASLEHPNAAFYASQAASEPITTSNHLFYLSGQLINRGEVDTSRCSGGGILLINGNAGACGEEAAYSTVISWQNQFDNRILNASQAHGLPPRILKGIFFQESQFWPDPEIPNEYGMGSLTDQGVDALLVTDPSAFLEVCLPALGEEGCAAGYASLTNSQRAVLRGMVLRAVGTEEEIDLVARVVLAQIIQVGKIAGDVVKMAPGQATSYEDLWDLTIASYHAGPGCIEQGLKAVDDSDQAITFDQFCQMVSSGCQSACTFTEKVKDYMQ